MNVKNLINIADGQLKMMLSCVDNDKEYGYDFTNKRWLDNNLYTPDRVISIDNFRKTFFYKLIGDKRLITFSSCPTRNMERLKDVEFPKGIVVIVKVSKDSVCTDSNLIGRAKSIIGATKSRKSFKPRKNPNKPIRNDKPHKPEKTE